MRQHKLFYGSSYDRGLIHLLNLWPKIIEKYPDATLDICYGWSLFLRFYADNPERMAWKERMDKLMTQQGITDHGRVSKKELGKIRQQCGIWAYPTDFQEINCITALQAQESGCVPCVINFAALKETVGAGIRIDGDIYDSEVKEAYLQGLFNLMGNEKLWKEEQTKGIEWAKNYSWDKIAKEWSNEF